MPLITTNQHLIEEKNKLLIKLDDSNNYKSDKDKKQDELRVGELENQILESTKRTLQELKSGIPTLTKEAELDTVKDLRALRSKKYDEYSNGAKRSLELYQEYLEKKKLGRELGERLKAVNQDKYDLKETVRLIRRY